MYQIIINAVSKLIVALLLLFTLWLAWAVLLLFPFVLFHLILILLVVIFILILMLIVVMVILFFIVIIFALFAIGQLLLAAAPLEGQSVDLISRLLHKYIRVGLELAGDDTLLLVLLQVLARGRLVGKGHAVEAPLLERLREVRVGLGRHGELELVALQEPVWGVLGGGVDEVLVEDP